VLAEDLPDRHVWFRVADPGWADPCDPSFAAATGGRWNPPGSFPTLYLNEDIVTARVNVQLFLQGQPYGPEDLLDDAGPLLVRVTLPRGQRVADVHSAEGVAAVGLPAGYPDDGRGGIVGHDACQPIGQAAHDAGRRGVRCRSARVPYGAGRELAWFPSTARSRVHVVVAEAFGDWFWS
jgi:hypothetical protein